MKRAALVVIACVAATPAQGLPLAEPDLPAVQPAPPRFARGLPTEGTTSRRYLLMTFDDGPRPETTMEVARYLRAQQIPAVFFVNGVHLMGPTQYARRNRAAVADLARMGFEVGNHGLTHAHLGPLLARETAHEIVDNERLLAEVTGRVPWLFRPAYGSLSLLAADVVEARGLTLVGWNLGTADFIEQSPLGLLHTFRKRLALHERSGVRGGILMLHDAHPWTVQAVPLLVEWVRRRNCELLATGEELYEFVDFSRFYVPRARHPGPLSLGESFAAEAPSGQDVLVEQARVRAQAAAFCAR